MWYRCNLKDYGASLYSSSDEAARGGQQAALLQPLLVKHHTTTRVSEVQQHTTAHRALAAPVITCSGTTQAQTYTTRVSGAGARCSPALLPTTGDGGSSSAPAPGSCPASVTAAATAAVSPPPAASVSTPDVMTGSEQNIPGLAAAPSAAAAVVVGSGPESVAAAAIKQRDLPPPTVSASAAADPSTAAVTLLQPVLAEVELQRSCSGERSSTADAARQYPDPLLHWTECWAGPGRHCRSNVANTHALQQQQSTDNSQQRQPKGGGGQHSAGPLSGAPQSPRSPCSPTRLHGVWWVGPEPPHTPAAVNTRSNVATAGPSTAGTAAAAAASTTPARQHDEITCDWISNSCSSIVGSPPSTRPGHTMHLQMQQLPQPLQASQPPQQPLQQQQHAQQQQQQQQLPLLRQPSTTLPVSTGAPRQRHMFRWWLVGGVALAALSGSAVVVAYGVITYMMKASMVYSFAWKAATGVATAEGLALGGWGCSSVRKEKAAAKQSAAELARIRGQASRELASLRSLLHQRDMAHVDEVATLSAASERLTRLVQSLRAENCKLQSALDHAAAERKSLEAAAALECSRAETSAVVTLAARHSDRVVDEVSDLRTMLLDLKEDLLGLVSEQAGSGQLTAEQSADLTAAAAHLNAQLSGTCKASGCGASGMAGLENGQPASTDDSEQREGTISRASSDDSMTAARPAVPRLKSVRGHVDAALAASVAETLQL